MHQLDVYMKINNFVLEPYENISDTLILNSTNMSNTIIKFSFLSCNPIFPNWTLPPFSEGAHVPSLAGGGAGPALWRWACAEEPDQHRGRGGGPRRLQEPAQDLLRQPRPPPEGRGGHQRPGIRLHGEQRGTLPADPAATWGHQYEVNFWEKLSSRSHFFAMPIFAFNFLVIFNFYVTSWKSSLDFLKV